MVPDFVFKFPLAFETAQDIQVPQEIKRPKASQIHASYFPMNKKNLFLI